MKLPPGVSASPIAGLFAAFMLLPPALRDALRAAREVEDLHRVAKIIGVSEVRAKEILEEEMELARSHPDDRSEYAVRRARRRIIQESFQSTAK